MQNMNMKIPGHQEKLKKQRREDKPFLTFTRAVCRKQHKRGKLFVVEQPDGAASWQESPMRELEDTSEDVIVDMCIQDLPDPMTKGLMTKRTRLRSNASAVIKKFATSRCKIQHPKGPRLPFHVAIEGTTTLADGTRVRRSEYAGWYTKKFAKNLIEAMYEELRLHGINPADVDDFDFDWIDAFADTGEVPAAPRESTGTREYTDDSDARPNPAAKRRKKDEWREQRKQQDTEETQIFTRISLKQYRKIKKTIAKLKERRSEALRKGDMTEAQNSQELLDELEETMSSP